MLHELTPEDLRFLPPNLPEPELLEFVESAWGITGEPKALAGERDQNFRLTTPDGERFILKVGSPMEDPSLVDFQVQALLRIESFDPSIPVPRLVHSRNGKPIEHLVTGDDQAHTIRLLTYVRGVPIGQFMPAPPAACRSVGRLQGRVCRALENFSHEAEDHFMPWDALNGLVESPALRLGYLPDDLQAICETHIDRLAADSLPRMRALPAQVIHNDAHSGNVMCDPDDPETITGVIDFGDLVHRPILTDLATSLTSFMGNAVDPLAAAGCLVGGFDEAFPVPHEQLELLYDAVLARSILTVQLMNFRARHTDHHESLVTVDVPDAIKNLRVILMIDPVEFQETVTP